MAFRKRFVISDESLNSYGTWLLSSGARMESFKKNAPCFYNHRVYDLPVGHWENISLDKTTGQWSAEVVIEGGNDYEKEIIRKIENGDIKGASMGVDILALSEDPKHIKPGQRRPTVTLWSPYECSLTPTPSNANALVLRQQDKGLQLSGEAADDLVNQILPLINNSRNMKRLFLKLGMKEDATEDEAIAALEAIQHQAAKADGLKTMLDKLAEKALDEKTLPLFRELSEESPKSAAKVLELATGKESAGAEGGKEKVSDLLEAAKLMLRSKEGKEGQQDKETFDYLQKNDPQKLLNLKRTEPDKYNRLVQEYLAGKKEK
jgi:hypothetical protein